MDDDQKARADELFEAALEERGARDPRDFYRDRLRDLKGSDPDAYEKAVTHYRDELIPGIAAGDLDPLEGWRAYGKMLAELTAEGRTVAVDSTGRARAYEAPADADAMVLHLPDDAGTRAILVSLPAEPSSAQRATFDLLVRGKQTLPG